MISDAKFRKLDAKKDKLQDKLSVKLARQKHLKEELEYLDYDIQDLELKIAEVCEEMQNEN